MDDRWRRRAAALNYTPGQAPATLVAKGSGDVAEQIMAIAREHGVPIHQDPALVGVLARLELEEQIPSQALVAVAAVIPRLGFGVAPDLAYLSVEVVRWSRRC
jgi:flagellar biosynthesis protein